MSTASIVGLNACISEPASVRHSLARKSRCFPGISRHLVLALISISSLFSLEGGVYGGDIQVEKKGGTLEIKGGIGKDEVFILFFPQPNNTEFVRVRNNSGRVNGIGTNSGGGDNFDLAGIHTINVLLGADRDNLSIGPGSKFLSTWNGNVTIDFGTTPGPAREHLGIYGPLKLNEVTVRGIHRLRQDTIHSNACRKFITK